MDHMTRGVGNNDVGSVLKQVGHSHKCSAVAKMGDSLATIDMGRKQGKGCCAPFLGGEMGPHLTQCGLGRGLPLYKVAS